MRNRFSIGRMSLALLLSGSFFVAPAEPSDQQGLLTGHREVPHDPPGKVNPRRDASARSASVAVVFGSYTSVQVNVDELQQNIVGDAANEPSIAVNPTNPDNIVIGWRQFDTVSSDFRQAGWAYTFDGGATWTFPGVLEPGVFRSDPVLAARSGGDILYQSLTANAELTVFAVDVFRSVDGGVTWPSKVPSFGGDKNWMVIDRTGGPSDGHVYGIWQRFFACCGLDVLTRSTRPGGFFEAPVPVAFWPTFGTMAVGPEGVLYMTGIDGTSGQDFGTFVVSRSRDAADPMVTPTTTGTIVDLGGSMPFDDPPNPGGLLGQPDVAVDLSTGPSRGNVYVLASVWFPLTSPDPMDVHFIRSVDGGDTWSSPVRVNDDPSISNWQWFGAVDVAPNGRIDAIWYDTRNSGFAQMSQLFYSYSNDTGQSWAKNVPASPIFDSTVGYAGSQEKIGDYIDLRSDLTGTNVAYAATMNGEQDVYFVRLFPDCNENQVPDEDDLSLGTSVDDDGNGIPDECDIVVAFGAGAVPDGAAVPGPQLTVNHSPRASNVIVLSWGSSCGAADTDYAVFEGALAPPFTAHSAIFCTTQGGTTKDLTSNAGSQYYLVVPLNVTIGVEGSYGVQSSGLERPVGQTTCLPQHVLQCP